MSSFVRIEFPKCSICLEAFGPQDEVMGHAGEDEKHPFHKNCLQNLLQASLERHPIFGVQPIKCPVCKIELSRSLPSDPIQNPAPSVAAATLQLAEPPVHWFDRLSLDAQILELRQSLAKGVITEDLFNECCAALRQQSR